MKIVNIAGYLSLALLISGTLIAVNGIKSDSITAYYGYTIVFSSLFIWFFAMKRYYRIRCRYEKSWLEIYFDWLYGFMRKS